MLRLIVPAIFATLLLASPLSAQFGRKLDGVPPGHRPPAGMCRIWIDGVPAGQQAAPTDCATAVRNRPANGRVVFGDENAKPGRKGFTVPRLRDDVAESNKPDDARGEKVEATDVKKPKAKKPVATRGKAPVKKGNPNDL